MKIMHLLVTDIRWDGRCPVKQILVLDTPAGSDADEDWIQDELSDLISDASGYCHKGFSVAAIGERCDLLQLDSLTLVVRWRK